MFQTENRDDVISCIDSRDGRIAVGTFRPFSSCSGYIFAESSKAVIHKLEHNFPIADLKLSPGAEYLVTVSDYIRVWNADTGRLLSVLSPHASQLPELCPFTAVSFAPNGTLFAVVDIRGHCSIWDVASKASAVTVFELASEKLVGVSFVTENIVGCVGESGALFVMDIASHEAVCSQNAVNVVPQCQPVKLAWLPNLSLVAIGYQISGIVAVFEIRSAKETPRLVGTTKNNGSIADICWIEKSPEYLCVARDSGAIEIWNKNNLFATHFNCTVDGGAAAVHSLADAVLIGTSDGRVVLSNLGKDMTRNPVPEFVESKMTPIEHQNSYPALA
jgi:WD40 repeat protein